MTTLKSNFSGNTFKIERDNAEGHVFVDFSRSAFPYASVSREEFAQAVRDLGFVVFEPSNLPVEYFRDGKEISVDGHFRTMEKEFYKYTPEEAEETGLRLLALSAHLKANPPIDPKVEALADLLESEMVPIRDERFTDLAARLIATGRIQVTE